MPGVGFDRAASFYDATRGLPTGVPEQVRDQIVRRTGAGQNTRFLEIGVGTGRIALPFADASFDVIIMIHLLHLVSDWRETLRECRRVLREGGWLVLSSNERAEQKRRSATAGRTHEGPHLVIQKWNEIMNELGQDRSRRQRGQSLANEEVHDALRQMGASVEHVTLAEYQHRPITAREMVGLHRDRIFSSDWHHSDDIHAEASRRLERWLEQEHRAPDAPYQAQVQFSVLLAHWPGGLSTHTQV